MQPPMPVTHGALGALARPWLPDGIDTDDHAAASAVLPGDVGIADWDALFGAVTTRLRVIAEPRSEPQGPPLPAAADSARAHVLECVSALDQLHSTLRHELDRCLQVERELLEVHAALAQSRGQTVGSRLTERRARHLAQHDELTALPNRSFFRERLDRALAPESAKPAGPVLTVLYVDLDGFKPINDQHGHEAGDAMLRIVAARLRRAVRAEDMVCRLGGDEFACLLADLMSREQLSHLACKLFDAVSAPLKIGPLELTVRPSIGIATCPDDGANAEVLLKRADAAMVRAKRHQLGYAFFDRSADC
jgi:diguanylate cyclase (GGDEF)-like protein